MQFNEAQINAIYKFTSADFIKRINDEDDTMLKHLDILQNINMKGFLTVQSQAGNKIINKKYEIYEKAFIAGFMLEDIAIKFMKNFNIYTDKNCINIPYSNNISTSLDIPLTITNKNGEINVDTHFPHVFTEEIWNYYRNELKLDKSEKIVFILCWDNKWNRNASDIDGLFIDAYKIL